MWSVIPVGAESEVESSWLEAHWSVVDLFGKALSWTIRRSEVEIIYGCILAFTSYMQSGKGTIIRPNSECYFRFKKKHKGDKGAADPIPTPKWIRFRETSCVPCPKVVKI